MLYIEPNSVLQGLTFYLSEEKGVFETYIFKWPSEYDKVFYETLKLYKLDNW